MERFSLSLAGRHHAPTSFKAPRPVLSNRSKALTGLAFATLVAGIPGTAGAEGSWSSSLSGVRSGYTSRQWTDRNSDGASTTAQLSGCSRSDGANFFLDVELRRRRSFAPDVSYGRKNVNSCTFTNPTVSWGRPGSGDFFFQFWHYDFGTVSARSVVARY